MYAAAPDNLTRGGAFEAEVVRELTQRHLQIAKTDTFDEDDFTFGDHVRLEVKHIRYPFKVNWGKGLFITKHKVETYQEKGWLEAPRTVFYLVKTDEPLSLTPDGGVRMKHGNYYISKGVLRAPDGTETPMSTIEYMNRRDELLVKHRLYLANLQELPFDTFESSEQKSGTQLYIPHGHFSRTSYQGLASALRRAESGLYVPTNSKHN